MIDKKDYNTLLMNICSYVSSDENMKRVLASAESNNGMSLFIASEVLAIALNVDKEEIMKDMLKMTLKLHHK
jgi:hypothetical protein